MSSAPATAATPTPAAEQPERKPGKPEGATLAQILERLQAVERLQTETLKALQETAAELAITPPLGAAHATSLRRVSLEAFDVPASPGAPVCSLTYTAALAA